MPVLGCRAPSFRPVEHIGRYRSFYGIEVELRADSVVRFSECEGLSTVYKHTAAKRAFVELRCDGQSLAIEVATSTSRV